MKKKCIVLIPGIPFPPVDGHKLKIFNLIKILNKEFDLHIITISKERIDLSQLDFISSHSYKYKHFKLSFFDNLKCMIIGFFSYKPFQVSLFSLRRVRFYLKRHREEADFIFLNLIRTADYIKIFEKKVIVLDIVDVISKNYMNSSKNTSSIFHKIIYPIEARRLERFERYAVKGADLTLCVNRDEAVSLSAFGRVEWIPNGIKPELFDYNSIDTSIRNSIAFFGTMFYQPNIDAMIWFEKYVMDYLDPSINIYIIGARPSRAIIKIGQKRKNVFVTGFLEDPYLILNSCFAVIAPMQNGGGIQNKIIETMAMGKINIITSYAALPIVGGQTGVHFIVEDSPKLMALKINDISKNSSNYKNIGYNARNLVIHNFTWRSYSTKLNNILTKDLLK